MLFMDSHELVTTLASYLPDLVLQRLVSEPAPRTAAAESFVGAVLVADVSGFTALTERLAASGAEGSEELTRILNGFFGRVIEIVDADGGDIVRFAGDAILAVWPAQSAADVPLATRAAASCALSLQIALRGYQTESGTPLAIKIGIGSGDFTVLHLGGEFDRWEFLVTGLAFVQSFAALDQAHAEHVVVSLQAWSHLQSEFTGHQLQMGSVLLEAGPDNVDRPGRDLDCFLQAAGESSTEAAIRTYVPGTVTARIAAGQEGWLGELRVVTVMFVNLPELNYATPLDRADGDAVPAARAVPV